MSANFNNLQFLTLPKMDPRYNVSLISPEDAEQLKRGFPPCMDDEEEPYNFRSRGPTKKVPLAFEKREFHNFQNLKESENLHDTLPLVTIKEHRYLFDKKRAIERLNWSRQESQAVLNNVKKEKETLKSSYIYREERRMAEEMKRQSERMRKNIAGCFQKFTNLNN